MRNPSREQILAFRYGRHHLGESLPRRKLVEAAEAGLQTGIPGTPLLALAARVEDLKASDLENALRTQKSLVETHSLRGATYIVPARDFPLFTTGVYPESDRDLEVFLGPGMRRLKQAKVDPREAVEAVTQAMLEILKGKALTQDEIHAEWRKRLPKKYLWECAGCKSFHVNPSVVGAVCASGHAAFGPLIDGDSAFVLARDWLPKPQPKAKPADAAAELARRFARYYGPADVAMFAAWTGTSRSQADAAWKRIESELLAIPFGKKTLWILNEDRRGFESPETPKGIHLLPARDPFLDLRDREILVPEKKDQSKVWRILANPGVLLVHGEVMGTWRAQRKGKTLAFGIEPFRKLAPAVRSELDFKCERIAQLRECESFKLELK